MSRGHIPYGYCFENGIAYVDEAKAEQIRTIFKEYISGNSLVDSAAEAGSEKWLASTLKKILSNEIYR